MHPSHTAYCQQIRASDLSQLPKNGVTYGKLWAARRRELAEYIHRSASPLYEKGRAYNFTRGLRTLLKDVEHARENRRRIARLKSDYSRIAGKDRLHSQNGFLPSSP